MLGMLIKLCSINKVRAMIGPVRSRREYSMIIFELSLSDLMMLVGEFGNGSGNHFIKGDFIQNFDELFPCCWCRS
jgi:hypothetical protein